MADNSEIIAQFALFSLDVGGIGSWISDKTSGLVLDRLASIARDPLTAVQFNQLLVLGHEAPVSDGFFKYYWVTAPSTHPYPTESLPGYTQEALGRDSIVSAEHLAWGLHRLYVDALLFFGNIRSGFRTLRNLSLEELASFFITKAFDTDAIKRRGPALSLNFIAKDDRYLISEMACKSYGDDSTARGDLYNALLTAYRRNAAEAGPKRVTVKSLLEGSAGAHGDRQQEFSFSADELLNETIDSLEDLDAKFDAIARKFFRARDAARENTALYLSMARDLDVYVATSMRSREDFRKMADFCENVFRRPSLGHLNLRYFDPTLSAASGHEDKGLIECLMVKCAKALVYCSGEKESYGKDAEAAMALSLGKPVIFYCDQSQKSRFYRDVHPLSRLIDFKTGVAVGAIVTDSLDLVAELLLRIFENKMIYGLQKPRDNYIRLAEELTSSIVRLQTSDRLLAEAFWNQYHGRFDGSAGS
jgi:hypothetical protein